MKMSFSLSEKEVTNKQVGNTRLKRTPDRARDISRNLSLHTHNTSTEINVDICVHIGLHTYFIS